jgi:hypothetical protein
VIQQSHTELTAAITHPAHCNHTPSSLVYSQSKILCDHAAIDRHLGNCNARPAWHSSSTFIFINSIIIIKSSPLQPYSHAITDELAATNTNNSKRQALSIIACAAPAAAAPAAPRLSSLMPSLPPPTGVQMCTRPSLVPASGGISKKNTPSNAVTHVGPATADA